MTEREAMKQAWAEMGWSAKEIRESMAFADRNNPQGIGGTLRVITPGHEREVIDACIEFSKNRLSNPVALDKENIKIRQAIKNRTRNQ